MELIKPGINIDFIGKRTLAYCFSGLMILASFASLIFHGGPRFGIDFAGGTLIQVKFPASVEVPAITAGLESVGMGAPTVHLFGDASAHEYLIRTDLAAGSDQTSTDALVKALEASVGRAPEIRRVEMVGPQVGQDLREKALFAIFFSLLFIAIYISGRFEFKWLQSGIIAAVLLGVVYGVGQFKVSIPVLIVVALVASLVLFWLFDLSYAMGAIVALMHDVIITLGVFSVFEKEISLPIIAALLTIIGYSLNDTIIVYDRIRENIRKLSKTAFPTILNRSVNETLSRTLLTAGTTFFAVLSLLVLGGGIIHDFAFAMAVGVIVGTYSSVYVASPVLIFFHERSKKRREGNRIDAPGSPADAGPPDQPGWIVSSHGWPSSASKEWVTISSSGWSRPSRTPGRSSVPPRRPCAGWRE